MLKLNTTQVFGCDLWDHVSHEHNPPLIPGFSIYKEHSGSMIGENQQLVTNKPVEFEN